MLVQYQQAPAIHMYQAWVLHRPSTP
jgi:hypothetical protein